jgi:exonuclease VII small subunit
MQIIDVTFSIFQFSPSMFVSQPVVFQGLTLEFRIGIAEVRSAVESKVDAMFVEACTQKSQSQFQSQLQQNLQSVQDRMQKMDSDLAESRTRTAALPVQTINTTNASSDIEKQLIGKLESEQMALRADVQSLSAQLKTLSTASGELDQRFSEGIHRLESGLSQLQQSTSHFRTFAEPILNRMETPLSSRILPALDKSLSLDVKPPSTPTSAYQQPLYAGQTFVHPGQWRKHKLLEYWSCCQTPATGNKDAIGCSLREEAQRRHGLYYNLPKFVHFFF